MHQCFKNPETGSGFLAYAMLGVTGALTALLIGSIFPSLIPAQIQSVKI